MSRKQDEACLSNLVHLGSVAVKGLLVQFGEKLKDVTGNNLLYAKEIVRLKSMV